MSSSATTIANASSTQPTRVMTERTASGRWENQPRSTTSSYSCDRTSGSTSATQAPRFEQRTDPSAGATASSRVRS